MIYFAQDTNRFAIKIGYSENTFYRMQALQTGNPYRLFLLSEIPGTMEDERKIHRELAASRMIGEWFNPTWEVLKTLLEKSLAASYGCERTYNCWQHIQGCAENINTDGRLLDGDSGKYTFFIGNAMVEVSVRNPLG